MFDTIIIGSSGGAGDPDAVALAELLTGAGGSATPVRVPNGQPVGRGLHDAAAEHGADLIVVASSGRGLIGRIFAGDDVAATLRSAPCPVAIAPRGFAAEQRAIARIGVGYDGSPQAQAALDAARRLAADSGAEVQALGVATPPQGLVAPLGVSAIAAIEARRERTERCIAALGPDVQGSVVDGIARERLAELADEVDLLVVGSSARGTVGRVLLGSASETLSRQAACPLLVVAAPAA